jgi:hypothetical protein
LGSPRRPRRTLADVLCGDLHVIDPRVWFRNRLAGFTLRLEVRNLGVLEVPARLFVAVGDNWDGLVRLFTGCLFDDYRITSCVHFSPAFLSVTFNPPGASSFPLLPGDASDPLD